jgi:hypothetical protein
MSGRRAVLIAIPIFILLVAGVAAGVVWLLWPVKTTLVIEMTGDGEHPVRVTAEEDGKTRQLEGVTPARFELKGHRILYSVASPAESGDIRFKAIIGDSAIGSFGLGHPPNQVIQGWVQSAWAGSPPKYWQEFKEDKWAKPPPW